MRVTARSWLDDLTGNVPASLRTPAPSLIHSLPDDDLEHGPSQDGLNADGTLRPDERQQAMITASRKRARQMNDWHKRKQA